MLTLYELLNEFLSREYAWDSLVCFFILRNLKLRTILRTYPMDYLIGFSFSLLCPNTKRETRPSEHFAGSDLCAFRSIVARLGTFETEMVACNAKLMLNQSMD